MDTHLISREFPTDDDKELSLELLDLLHSDFETDQETRANILDFLNTLFAEWVTSISLSSSSKIVPFGSYRLGVHSPDSDLDLLAMVTQGITRANFEGSFMTLLCAHPEVKYCVGIFSAKVPLIKLSVGELAIDLLFACVPSLDFDVWDDSILLQCDEPTALSLNGYRSTEITALLVPDLKTFRVTLRAVRLWAKKRGLYSNILGFLGGAAWSILAAKVCRMYPHQTSSQLLFKLFKLLYVWDWHSPITLRPLDAQPDLPHLPRWSPSDKQTVNILTPAFPAFNTAYCITRSSLRLLLTEVELALKVTSDIVVDRAPWTDLFTDLDFFQSYQHLLQIEVLATSLQDFQSWHGLVQNRLKFLVLEIENSSSVPHVRLLPKAFQIADRHYAHSVAYFLGLKASGEQDLRFPVANFCNSLEEQRQLTASLRVRYVHRSKLCADIMRQLAN
jgi:poly(A) polymerase